MTSAVAAPVALVRVPDLEAMKTRHRSIARYRVVKDERIKPAITTLRTGLTWDEGVAERDRLTAAFALAYPKQAEGFGRTLHELEIENPEECWTPEAKDRKSRKN